jgi:hypothetical protein
MLADTSTPQKYFSIDVRSPRSPTLVKTTTPSIDTRTAIDMAAQNDLVVVAYGDTGIIIYRVSDDGALNPIQSFNSTGYANKLFFNGNSLVIFSDEEPYNATTAPTSANVLITMNLIDSVDSATGQAVLTTPLAEQNSYMHSTPIDGDNVNLYRMVDGVSYRPNEFMVLSADVNNPNNQRISIINTAGSAAYLVSDTQLNVTTPLRVATNSQSVAVLARQATITSPDGYVLVSYLQAYGDNVINLLMSQSVTVDGSGTSYLASPSITIAGSWFPLTQIGSASTITRLANGNYLLTATLYIDSTVDSALFVAATGGLDVEVIPNEISTRIILDSSKSSILAQAVNIGAKGVK